jgi:hypothetical protein
MMVSGAKEAVSVVESAADSDAEIEREEDVAFRWDFGCEV